MMENKHLLSVDAVNSYEVVALQELSVQCFIESFGNQNTAEDMAQYIAQSLSLPKLESEIQTEGSSFYFITYNNERIGYFKTNTGLAQTEPFDRTHIELERIYILRKFQRNKIGQYILDHIVKTATEGAYKIIWLGVWENNEGAIRLYQNNGFSVGGSHSFQLGNDTQTDLIMKKNLAD